MPDRCRTCKAQVIWVKTEKGRSMPVDVDPVDGGNIMLMEHYGQPPIARMVAPVEGVKCYVSHFATCKHADQHRKR